MVSKDKFQDCLYQIFSQDPQLNSVPLEQILNAISTIDQIVLAASTPVLIRADLDVPLKDGNVADASRLEANLPTIQYATEKGWIPILLGHIGRDPKLTLEPVCRWYADRLDTSVTLITDWLDVPNRKLSDDAVSRIKAGKPGDVFILENTRKYDLERALWKADKEAFPAIAESMYQVCMDIRNRLATVEINEAIAASNIDFSSTAIPLVMDQTGLGFFISKEMREHITNARKANLVIFSGLKINKLDDLERIVDRGQLQMIISAGSLAMALRKASAQLDGSDFSIGLAETNESLKSFIPAKRIEQAKRIVKKCREYGIELVLPVDFVLDDGTVSETIPTDRMQMDIGPKTIELISDRIQQFIQQAAHSDKTYCAYYNGVFGKFEDPKFEKGTRAFIPLLKQMTQAGVQTYVGGGEGRFALLKYGSESDVTHAFTCGGTVLKSLTNYHIAYLKAMYLQTTQLRAQKS